MRIDLHLTPHQTDELALREKTVVVIDVLRACTSIVTALHNGAREIIPVDTVESAVKISGNLLGDFTLLGGERNGKMIEGFHVGNSPGDYSAERVKGKAIIFSSTNGAQAMVKARFARELFLCSFVNVSTVAASLREDPRDCIVVCAGNNGVLSMEDTVCGGMLIAKIADDAPFTVELSDAALAAHALYKKYGRGILRMMKNSDHGRYLQGIGFGDDLRICAGVDTMPVLPQLDGNVIRLKRETVRKEPTDQQVAG